MNMKSIIINTIFNILISIFTLLFLLSLLWFINGSSESFPTAEQEEKIKIFSGFIMFIFGFMDFISISIKISFRKFIKKYK